MTNIKRENFRMICLYLFYLINSVIENTRLLEALYIMHNLMQKDFVHFANLHSAIWMVHSIHYSSLCIQYSSQIPLVSVDSNGAAHANLLSTLKAQRIEGVARTDETADNEDAHGDRDAYEHKPLGGKHIGNCLFNQK